MIRDRSRVFHGKILIVDDVPANLRLLSDALLQQGYEVQCAITGELALLGASTNPPDLILLDIRMPQMDGYAICQQLKAFEHTRDIPIIFLSALDEPLDKVRAFDVGGVDYITKPFQIPEVLARVHTHISLQQAKIEILQLNAELEQRVRDRTTALQQLNLELRASEERFRMVANVAPVLIWMSDQEGCYIFFNQRWFDFTGRTLEQEVNQGWLAGVHPDDRAQRIQTDRDAFVRQQPFTIEYRLRQANQTYRWVMDTGIPLHSADKRFIGYIGSCIDIHDRKQAEELLLYNAFHDALTDLPNRSLLMERLDSALVRTKQSSTFRFAVLFLDLDRFNVINDSLGHLVGDRLLMAISYRLDATLSATDFMARLGGDEFVILLENVAGIEDAIICANRIFQALRPAFLLEGRDIFMTASIGIVLSSPTYNQPLELLRDADIAMYRAKAQGKARYEVFNSDMHLEVLKRLHLESDLRKALEHQQFILHYQPIVALTSGKLVGFEALVRWQHPLRGLISPTDFIPIAEETGLILTIGLWVLRTACRQVKVWQTQVPSAASLKMSVNLSAQQLREPGLIEQVDQVLAETWLDGSSLTLEITESMLIENTETVIRLLDQLRSRAIQINIDDFGTGYSSLSYLHRFPIHALKIDRSFVHSLADQTHPNIAEIIIMLTHQLGLTAIAEGIETETQLYRLRALGCELAQGYLLSEPLTAQAAEQLLLTKATVQSLNDWL